MVNQIRGSHRFGGITRDLLNFTKFQWLDELTLDWFYSDSTSRTDIPNETNVVFKTSVDGAAQVLSESLQASSTAVHF